MSKNLSNKYGQNLLDSAKISATDAIKTAPKRDIEKTAEATGDLIGNEMSDKIMSVSNMSPKELHSKELQNDEMKAPIKRYISPVERQQISDELRLVYSYNHGISKNTKFVRQHIKSTI